MASRGNSLRVRMDQIFHSIRFRLVLWFVLILGIVMAIFSSFIYLRQAQDLRSFALPRLNNTLERLNGSTGEGDHGNEPLQTGNTMVSMDQLNLNSNLLENEVVALETTDGTIEQSYGALTTEQIQKLNLPLSGWKGVQQTTVPKISQVATNEYLFINPTILQNGQVTGYLLVGVPLDANDQLGRLIISLVLGNVLTLAIALTGGFWLADRAMRPVHTITQTARQIGESDLQKRLHLKGKDELAELGNTFDEMLDRLQVAFERQRQFTADASHELRTPLTIIDLEASRALANHRSADETNRILQTIKSENQSMIRLVNNLLSLARMDAGQINLKIETLDLSEVTLEVVERMGPLAAAKGVSLVVEDLPDIPIQGDHSTLVQMLTNIVENAIKYTASAENPKVRISAGVKEADGRRQAWARVSDNGIGIPKEHLEHIFDRFYQVEASRTQAGRSAEMGNEQESSGTGLGLAIARWIATTHQGDIQVESKAGRGSTFEVILPIYNPNE